ncbi:unnamed protein product [Alopecurus aequalis]
MAQLLVRLHEQHASLEAISLVVVVMLLSVVLLVATSRSSRTEKLLKKIPSPPFKLPIIGHLHLVGSHPHVSLTDLARKHGPDVMLLRLGTVPTLIVSSPSAAKTVLRTHDHIFASRPPSTVADILFNGSTNIANAPYGDYWRHVRKIITTHLLTPRKVRSNLSFCEIEVQLVLARLREAATARTTVDLSKLFSYYVKDVVCQAVLGRLPREAGWNKAARHKKRWDDLLDDLIDKHTSKPVGEYEDEDFLDVLLSAQTKYNLTRHNIKAILMDVFEAATHTTYIALDYAMAELIRKPHVMYKLQTEVRRCKTNGKEVAYQEDLSSLTYLRAVMKETLRLHPPGPLLAPHFSMADCDVEGYIIPSRTRVVLNVWALGRDSSCWENPEEFMPKRFLEEGVDAASEFQGNDFRFLPFGSGRRICPAISFATATFEIMLANLIYHFNWELPAGLLGIDMTEVFGLDVHRKENLLLVPCIHT